MKRLAMTVYVLLTVVFLGTCISYAQGPTPPAPPSPAPTPAISGGVQGAGPTPQPTKAPGKAEGAAATAAPVFNPDAITEGLMKWSFWAALFMTLVGGALGGVAYELLILQGNIECWHKTTKEEVTETFPYAIPTYLYDLGILARVIIGALAAVAALFVLSPQTTFSLLATSLVAGSAGTSVFRSLQDRLSAAIAQKTAADTKAKADTQAAKTDEAVKAFADLKKKLMEGSVSHLGTNALTFGPEKLFTLDLDHVDKVERLMCEARGVSGTT